MRKLMTLLLTIPLLFTACSGKDQESELIQDYEEKITQLEERIDELEKENEELKAEEQEEETTSSNDEVFRLEEEWMVDGLFKLTIDDVTVTSDRNSVSEKDPAEVVVITYSYENLGYEGDVQDLFITPERVIDENGEMAETYPAGANTYAQPTPIGAKMVGAEEAYGLNNESSTIKVLFEVYDDDFNKYKKTFEVPVSK